MRVKLNTLLRKRAGRSCLGAAARKTVVAILVGGLGAIRLLAVSTPDAASLARAVDDHYNHLSSLKADFTEIYRGSGIERTESGTLWLKKPGKMRWDYRSPREKVFLSDGRSVWLYTEGDRQARKGPARRLDDARSPMAFLLGKLKLEKELQGLSIAADQNPVFTGDTLLRGVPKGMEDQISAVQVEVTPRQQIARIVIEQADGSSTEFRFGDQLENVEVPDAEFRFSLPPGVEISEEGLNP